MLGQANVRSEKSICIAKHSHGFGVEISPERSETMAFSGQNPVRCKIIVETKVYKN
jgi:hypothetical protein